MCSFSWRKQTICCPTWGCIPLTQPMGKRTHLYINIYIYIHTWYIYICIYGVCVYIYTVYMIIYVIIYIYVYIPIRRPRPTARGSASGKRGCGQQEIGVLGSSGMRKKQLKSSFSIGFRSYVAQQNSRSQIGTTTSSSSSSCNTAAGTAGPAATSSSMANPQKSNWLAATSSSIAEQQKSNGLFNRISEGTFRPPGSLLLRMTLRHFRHEIRWCFAVSSGFRKWSTRALLSIDLPRIYHDCVDTSLIHEYIFCQLYCIMDI